MRSLEQLSAYLQRLEGWFRLAALARGAAVAGAAAVAGTVLGVLFSNRFAFSGPSLTSSRVFLFLAVALAAGFGLVIPWFRLNRRKAARAAEQKFPQFEERLLTLAERADPRCPDPFLELLAADTVEVTTGAAPERVLGRGFIMGFASAAVLAVGVLVWLVAAGPGYLGYGASLLWAGTPRGEDQFFYSIVLEPGDRSVRRGASQAITARVRGFQPQSVRLFARYRSASKWEEAPMLPQEGSAGFAFLFAGIPETLDYYAVAGAVRSKTHTLTIIDLPVIRRIRVTYRYPEWTGLKEAVEDPGGDLRAVEGTEAEISVEADRPISKGVLALDDSTEIALSGDGNRQSGRLAIRKDGLYYIAVRDQGELVRLSDDYFIEARKDGVPAVRIKRPGHDAKVSPIEEVTIVATAEDDFGLQDLSLHYSVNGGPENTIPRPLGNARTAENQATLFLEDFQLVPGDVVAIHATARDAHASATTDVYFLEAQPFEREYSQSQIMGGGGAQGGQGRISQRQKEIIAATWNQLRQPAQDQRAAAENARFLADVQTRLRDQARSLATRMRRRQLAGANQEFENFSREMEKAAEAMGPAADKLRAIGWREALPHEQKALQHLLRAEATYRQIQMAFGTGAGGGDTGRDLESLFDLELDMEKNQYETGQQSPSGGRGAREVEEALQRLEDLARRQQELAEQQRRNPQAFQQRWQQEALRREAEELRRRIEQLTRGETSQQMSQGQGQGSGAQGAASGSARSQDLLRRREQADPRLEEALRRLREAAEDMRRAGSQGQGQGEAESRRAAERLREAGELMRGLRRQETSQQLDNVVRQAEEAARRQQEFANRLEELYRGYPPPKPGQGTLLDPKQREARQMAGEKLAMAEAVERLERDLKSAARDLAQTNPSAGSKIREALGNMQKNDLALRMRYSHEMLRRGWGQQAWLREGPVTQALEQLRDEVREAQAAAGRESGGREGMEAALAEVERLRSRAERMAQAQRSGQGGNRQPSTQGSRGGGAREERGHGASSGPVLSAMNQGDLRPPEGGVQPRAGTAEDLARFYRESFRDLAQLRRSLAEEPEAARTLEALIREMQRLDPGRFPGNPALLEQVSAQLLPALQQLELQLRLRLDEKQAGQVRTGAPEPAPPGWAEAVAEYFRRLSQGPDRAANEHK